MSDNVGKIFETEIEKVFRLLEADFLIAWHRFPDTHSAGGAFIQPQPSDYLLGLPPGGEAPLKEGSDQRLMFVEAKASGKHKSLQKAAISAHQRGRAKVYAGLLQIPYLVIHYSAVTGKMEVWNGLAATEEGRIIKSHLLHEFVAGHGQKLDVTKTADELAEFFSLPSKIKTITNFQAS